MIYSLYVFDRHCNPIFYYSQAGQPINLEDAKLVYGVVFSLRNIIQKVSTEEKHDGYLTYKTSQYRLGYYQTPTIKFAFFSNPELETGRVFLQKVYEIYVEYVSKNSLIPFDSPIENDLFRSKVKALALSV